MTGMGLNRAGVVVLSLVADATVRALVVAAVAGAILTMWRQVSVPRRALIWTTVLYGTLALPVLLMVVPAKVRVTPSSVPMISTALSQIATPVQTFKAQTAALFVSRSVLRLSGPAAAGSGAPVPLTWLDAIFLTYLAGALWLTGRVVRAWFLARGIRRGTPVTSADLMTNVEAEAHRIGLGRVPRVVEQVRIAVPMTSGVLRPVIALPADWREWPTDVMRAVLVHELTHVARRDTLTQTFSRLNRALAWVNPLSWWLHRHVANLAEQVSDDAALDAGIDQTTYAETLLMFAQRLPTVSQGREWAVAMARQRGEATERRIDRVLAWEPGGSRQYRSVMRRLIVVVAGLVVLVTASVRLDATRAAASLALTPLQVAPAAAPSSGLTAVPLAATLDLPSPSVERPGRHAPEVVRGAMPSAPAMTLPAPQVQGQVQALDEEALRAARDWVFMSKQGPVPVPVLIREGFGAGAYRPGGGITNPVILRQVDPQYTPAAAANKIEGDVELEAVILPDGTVGDIRVSRSLDAKNGLDDSAVRAARLWTFKPATLNGTPVAMIVTLQCQFRLSNAKQIAGVPAQSGAYVPQALTDDFANGAYWIGTEGLTPPAATATVLPKYTSQAMRDKIQGDVVVEVIVMPDGSVGKARVAISLDPIDGLDDNALAAAQHYRFTPGILGGRAVPVLVAIALNFRLH